jgi:triosephosphate isomerase
MTTKTAWIGTSWKMNKTLAEALHYADALAEAERDIHPGIQSFVIPPFTAAREVKARLVKGSVKVGAQNMHWEDRGAWTGEISPLMLADCRLDLVELGHSERRIHFGDTDDTVARKTLAALQHGLTPLICIGETLEEKETGRATEVVERQVLAALSRIPSSLVGREMLFAYEPVWSIGHGGTPASADYAEARHREVAAVVGNALGRAVPCLYGGSVNAENCCDYLRKPHVDGLFIGRAAWEPNGYLEILGRCADCL